MGCHEF
jgi:hypothetical protein